MLFYILSEQKLHIF